MLSPAEEVLSRQCCCCTVLWCTGSHLIISSSTMMTSPFFVIPWERVSWVPWLLRVVFQLSLECLWTPLTWSSLSPGHHENHLIWVSSSLVALLELSIFFQCLYPPPHGSTASPPNCPENHLIWDSNQTVPLGLLEDFLLELPFRTVYALLYIVCCFIPQWLFVHPVRNDLIRHGLILLFNYSSKLLFWILFDYFNYCFLFCNWKWIQFFWSPNKKIYQS
jgi:hypothetical protein